MDLDDYPALYVAADAASTRYQATYLRLVIAEYATLFLASIFALDLSEERRYYVAYGIVFTIPFIVMLWRSYARPEKTWYQARAVAESVKTLTWRYVMRAEPFSSDHDQEVSAILRNRLTEILRDAQHIGDALSHLKHSGDQVTRRMNLVRQFPLLDRLEFYRQKRLEIQRNWYTRRARTNQNSKALWIFASAIFYLLGIATVLIRVAKPDWRLSHPEPLIVMTTAIAGWIQLKRFSEISSSYTLTAHEIGLVNMDVGSVVFEKDLSDFVNEAELVFSREHTQWVARR